jgi:hypothetical protein
MNLYQIIYPDYYEKYLIDFKYFENGTILDSFISLINAHSISNKSITIIKQTIKESCEIHKNKFPLDEDDYLDLMSIDQTVVSALFINLYGIIELESIRLCKHFIHMKKLEKNKQGDKGIDRIANLIKEKKGINFKSNPLYNQMVEMRDIRNCLAHANGYIPDYNDSQKIVAIAKKHDFLNIIDDSLMISPSSYDTLLEYGFKYNYHCVHEILNGI